MKRLHKIGDLIVLQIDKHENCIHPILKMSKNAGEKICAKCGRSIYIIGDPANPLSILISQSNNK